MADQPTPSRPIDAYKAIIDQLVDLAKDSYRTSRIKKAGVYSNAPAHLPFNEILKSLTDDQREVVATILQRSRHAAIHDALALLSWWIAQGVGATYKGQHMPVDLSDMGLHGDFVGRGDGWKWPEEE